MEKLTIAGTFQKSVDFLKNTVGSQKDKLHHFRQLSECILSPHFHVNHLLHTSTAISVLLLFCEDSDSTIRMNAEENLCKIIRHCENGNIQRVQVDLYHEIKKNGNERSLRICLNIFSHYCPQIKQRKARSYAQNMLQCIAAIARRRETLLLESLTEFIKVFCKYLQCNVMDNELVVVLQIFLDDLSSTCAVKRRCSAQNLVTFIQHSRKTCELALLALSKAQEILVKQQSPESTVGVLGFIRLIVPVLLEEKNCDLSKLLEVYEICLGYLQDGAHSIINASLEVLNVMTLNPPTKWRKILTDIALASKEILLKKRGFINSITIESDSSVPEQLIIEQSPDEENVHLKAQLLCESIDSTSLLASMSDVESESLKSMDIKTDFTETVGGGQNSDTKSLKSQKSTDSIGSFFNSLLTNPLPSTTETVTNFFRGQKSNESSVTNTPKYIPRVVEEMGESSHEVVHGLENIHPGEEGKSDVKNSPDADKEEDELILEYDTSASYAVLSQATVEIGTIFDQSVISYTVRLIASKFILSGNRGGFVSDQQVRVSIKNLSLTVIANCVLLSPHILVQPLEMQSRNELIKIELERATEEIKEEVVEVETSQEAKEASFEKNSNSEGYLEMKDDHFGKSTTSYKDYFTPLAKSIDTTTLLGQLESWTTSKVDLAPKINRDLSAMLTKASGQLKISTTPICSTPRKLSPKASDKTQYLVDILQLCSHQDPIIRSDIIQIVGNFVKCLSCGLMKYEQVVEDVRELLKFPKLIEIVVQGLSDENHAVVRQALSATENILPHWLLCGIHNTTIPEIISVDGYLARLLDVNDIKYWTVQCKYSEVLANLDFRALHELLGRDTAIEFETMCIKHIIRMLGDEDARIRSAAAKSLSHYTVKQYDSTTSNNPMFVLRKDLCGRIFQELPPPLNAIELSGNTQIDHHLVKTLYILSNKLMESNDRETIVGVLSATKELSNHFRPTDYFAAWNEFNFLGVVIKYIQENPITVYDLTAHSDALELCTRLLAAKALRDDTEDHIEALLIHLLKVINVYHHIFTGTKVITLPKGQKSDIFLSGKDTMKLNNLGYFGNDFVYIKLYRMLKMAFDSRRITIDKEVSAKMMTLLGSCLETLTLIFEIKPMVSISQSTAIIEEILTYLMSCVNYQPNWCVLCTKHMLRHFFDRNFVSRRTEFRHLFDTCGSLSDVNEVETLLKSCWEFGSAEKKSLPYEDVGHHLKIFEPMVIHSLRLFMKANSKLQAVILELLCQLLDFKVNYYLLDANNVFIEYILRHLEIIETGSVRKCEVVIGSIYKFLFHLCKSKDKKIITIPKIINITDNLLANSGIRTCSIRALVELGHELFFNAPPTSTGGKSEWNTEKEVVFTMMLKFLDYAQVQRAVALIVLSQRNMEMSYEMDALTYLLTLLQDEKFSIDCEEKLNGMILLFRALERQLDREKLDEFLRIFLEAVTSPGIHYNKLTRVHLLLSQVILHVEEVYLINCIKLHLVKMKLDGVEDGIEKVEHENGLELNYFAKIVSRVVEDSVNFLIPWSDSTYSALLEVFLGKLCQLANFNALSTVLLDEFVNGGFIQLFHSVRTVCPKLFIAFMDVMIHLNYDQHAVVEALCRLSSNLCDRQLRGQLSGRITEKYHQPTDWQPNTIQLLLQSDLPAFLREHHKFLSRLCCSKRHANGILALVTVCHTEFHSIAIDNEILKLIDKSHHSAMVLCLQMLLGKFLAHTSKSMQQRALVITVGKVDTLRAMTTAERDHTLPLNELTAIIDDCKRENLPNRFPALFATILELLQSSDTSDRQLVNRDGGDVSRATVDEQWYCQQILYHMAAAEKRSGLVARLLIEIKSEMRLSSLITSREFSSHFLTACLGVAFDAMRRAFQTDCVQHSPHMTYLKVPPLLKFSQRRLEADLAQLTDASGGDEVTQDQKFRVCLEAATCFIENVSETERTCLVHIDGRQVEKYIGEHLLRPPLSVLLLTFATRSVLDTLRRQRETRGLLTPNGDLSWVEKCLHYMKVALHQDQIWQELDSIDKHYEELRATVELIRECLMDILSDTHFVRHHQEPDVFASVDVNEPEHGVRQMYMNAIFVARFIEEEKDIVNCCMIADQGKVVSILRVMSQIATAILRVGVLYPIAMTPFILLHDMGPLTVEYPPKRCPIPSIPIEQLNDSELLPKFISRLNLIGFSTRQQFEEIFMSLLVLLNSDANPEIIDVQEEYFVKSMCLDDISEFVVTCKMFPRIGSRQGEFHHSPRLDVVKVDGIGVKKLHKILSLIPGPNVFYQSNLERDLSCDRVIGTHSFAPNQFSMNFIWQIVEENVEEMDTTLKSVIYFVDQCGIDFRSTVQLIYDVFAQLIDQQCTHVLANIAKLSDVCENRDQCKWIRNTMQQLQERIPLENTVAHQYIIYLLCKSHAILVPSLSDLAHLCSIIPTYLKSTHVFVRNATLNGLLCLLESAINTNTSIGALSEEIILLRNIAINYINKNGVTDESAYSYSDTHTKLVWTLTFYLIEKTSKFMPDCTLLSNVIISGNNILKRTTNLLQYLCIIHGMQRLIITNSVEKVYREKMEKLSLDLVKCDNEEFYIPALKLLISCMYIGSASQLENTEHSNGIVQDEPEVIVQSTEKIDVLFLKIKSSTPEAANIIGDVLCQITRDLVPPNEILTKVIKELLSLTQPHGKVVAKIVFQVFRSAIDSAYLALLQDWLICSLPNFVVLPPAKAVSCMSVIFVSASLNLNLIKIFPEILETFGTLGRREEYIFHEATRDFHGRLSEEQKDKFSSVFLKHESSIYANMLKNL
uniref:Huntingtin n=1 Tax=Phlebotomus kandelakii TaxID=1109342 RepID=A0A6B2E671_9DIPT